MEMDNEYQEKYHQLVFEAEELTQKIGICEECISLVLEYVASQGELAMQIGESILSAVHTVEKDLQTELLHLKLEKGLLANQIKLMTAQ